MIKAMYTTKDKRTFNGYNVRSKFFHTDNPRDPEIINWVKKNKKQGQK